MRTEVLTQKIVTCILLLLTGPYLKAQIESQSHFVSKQLKQLNDVLLSCSHFIIPFTHRTKLHCQTCQSSSNYNTTILLVILPYYATQTSWWAEVVLEVCQRACWFIQFPQCSTGAHVSFDTVIHHSGESGLKASHITDCKLDSVVYTGIGVVG